MQDRFKFRIALHQDKYEEYGLEDFKHQKLFEVQTLNTGYENSTVVIIADYQNGDWAVREIDEADIDLIQCTGLKDKNGRLIYEGDIVETWKFSTGKTERKVIVWNKARCGFRLLDISYYNRRILDYPQSMINVSTIEVLGNIYENKELLEETNGRQKHKSL